MDAIPAESGQEEDMNLLNAKAVSKLLGVNEKKAHEIIRQLNAELESKGFLTIQYRVPERYLLERFYG